MIFPRPRFNGGPGTFFVLVASLLFLVLLGTPRRFALTAALVIVAWIVALAISRAPA
jgi:hypothetical protein